MGELLKILFNNNPSHTSGEPDPRGTFHVKVMVSTRTEQILNVGLSSPLIYKHKHSAPLPGSPRYSERYAPFLAAVSPAKISHARHSLRPTNLVVNQACHGIYGLTDKDDQAIFAHPTP